MQNTLRLLFIFLVSLLFNSVWAQNNRSEEAERLFEQFKKASRFDYTYPREKVYVHFDNSAYMVGDSIWYKAYVVRASSLRPTQLSGILYVDLLNADGQCLLKQVLKIDSLGTAQGVIALPEYAYAGYYEVRAYTREMVNWGKYACFSRVLPVFTDANPQKKEEKGVELSLLQLSIPQPNPHKYPTWGKPRPYVMKSNKVRMLDFYPEGGNRAKRVAQRVAYKLTDGTGMPLEDSVRVFYADGRWCTTSLPEHEGMGTFILPTDFENGYACVGEDKEKFELPECVADYAMTVVYDEEEEGLLVNVTANENVAHDDALLALAVFNRENACFFDTLSVGSDECEVFIAKNALREGVNRIELFDKTGRGLATRLFWKNFETGRPQNKVALRVMQNEKVYKAFSPAVVKLVAKDSAGKPVPNASLSVAVRDEKLNLLSTDDGGFEGNMLLASELRGYIHRPELYFKSKDAAHQRMIDLLMMVQGWYANSFDVMCQRDRFNMLQPIEDKLIVKGTTYKYNNKREPLPNLKINMMAYGYNNGVVTGHAIDGETQSNEKGKFAFMANADIQGEYLALFKLQNEEDKKKWCKLSIDRWFDPPLLPFTANHLNLNPYEPKANSFAGTMQHEQNDDAPEVFLWKDTIPNIKLTLLNEAKVTANIKRYKGLKGDRYSWGGGESYGIKRSTTYYNIERECERLRDYGISTIDFFSFLDLMDRKLYFNGKDYVHALNDDDAQLMQTMGDNQHLLEEKAVDADNVANGDDDGAQKSSQGSQKMKNNDEENVLIYKGRAYEVKNGNDQALASFKDDGKSCDDLKSVCIVKDILATDYLTGEEKRISSERDKMYIYERQDEFRTRNKRGKEYRHIQGITPETKFFSPNYRQFDLPSDKDVRRTLYWNPQVMTDANGEANVIFFTNSREGLTLDMSVRGITKTGKMIDWN